MSECLSYKIRHTDYLSVKKIYCSKRVLKEPFVPAVLRTASAHYISRVQDNAPSEKVAKRQLSHSLIPLHFVPLHSLPDCLHILESSQEAKQEGKARGHCESKARSNASTGRPVAPGTAGRTAKKQSSSPLLPLCVLPVSARSNRCRVTLFARRQFFRLSRNFR